MQVALEEGSIRGDSHSVSSSNVDEVRKADILRNMWFMDVFLAHDVVAKDRVLQQVPPHARVCSRMLTYADVC